MVRVRVRVKVKVGVKVCSSINPKSEVVDQIPKTVEDDTTQSSNMLQLISN